MKPGDSASYSPVSVRGFDGFLRVHLECLDQRSFENDRGETVQQWHFEVEARDKSPEHGCVLTEEVVVSIVEKTEELYLDTHDGPQYSTLIWVAKEDPRRSAISATLGTEQPEYPWAVNHDGIIEDYSTYGARETITSAVLNLIEKIDHVFN